jgi:hypothetical protein
MFGIRYFCHERKPTFGARIHHPLKTYFTHAFKRIGTSAGLPDATSEQMNLGGFR